MNKIALIKLSNHLADKKTPGFDMCDYAACAIGECVYLFPANWTIFAHGFCKHYIEPRLRDTRHNQDPFADAQDFFNLSIEQARYLFMPNEYQETEDENITPLMVAERIRNFINSNGKIV